MLVQLLNLPANGVALSSWSPVVCLNDTASVHLARCVLDCFKEDPTQTYWAVGYGMIPVVLVWYLKNRKYKNWLLKAKYWSLRLYNKYKDCRKKKVPMNPEKEEKEMKELQKKTHSEMLKLMDKMNEVFEDGVEKKQEQEQDVLVLDYNADVDASSGEDTEEVLEETEEKKKKDMHTPKRGNMVLDMFTFGRVIEKTVEEKEKEKKKNN